MTTHEEVSLQRPRAHSSYWRNAPLTAQEQADLDQWKAYWAEFNEAIDAGERVFVKVVAPKHKHQGSIALVTNRELAWGHEDDWRKSDHATLALGWDKRKNAITEWSGHDIRWLRGYTGDTVYDYDRQRGIVKPEDVTLEDRTGRPIKVGDFCCYILHHFDRSGASIYFGTVTKFSKHGTTAYCKNIKLAEDDEVAEKRVTYSENIVVLTKDLMDRLMLARLSVA